jgi:hypothetical protein
MEKTLPFSETTEGLAWESRCEEINPRNLLRVYLCDVAMGHITKIGSVCCRRMLIPFGAKHTAPASPFERKPYTTNTSE